MPSKNILISCMSLVPHVIRIKKIIYMSLNDTQVTSIKSDGIQRIFHIRFMQTLFAKGGGNRKRSNHVTTLHVSVGDVSVCTTT
jgi:hypothetical protein